jgi:hypothetical protein
VGAIESDFRGYMRLEPLLSLASNFVFDVETTLLAHTNGVDPNGMMFGVDDGTRVMQVAFLADQEAPKLSYGGRSLPEDFTPYVWSRLGGETAEMAGRYLKLTDTSAADGIVYYIEDTEPVGSSDRVVSSAIDYILETRFRVDSYTPDSGGFCGVFGQVYDSARIVGFMLTEDTGVRYIQLMSDGVGLGSSARFAFEWADGEFHAVRLVKSTSGNLVTALVDGELVGTWPYSSFTASASTPEGLISFGSSTPASTDALSEVAWDYCNVWRVLSSVRRYVGLWKGSDPGSLVGYHLPLKTSGRGAQATQETLPGHVLIDTEGDFIADNVVSGDQIVVDVGPNKGVYTVNNVLSSTKLSLVGSWLALPPKVDYRIVKETDWSTQHKYRLQRTFNGEITLLLDVQAEPLLRAEYGALSLPASGSSIIQTLAGGVPALVFGSFSSEHLEMSLWDYVRYGITRSPTELRIAPHHQVMNQWNVMHSAERLRTTLPHDLTDYKSSSTGIVPRTDPDFLRDDGLTGITLLNEGTPIVPKTQNWDNRGPYATTSPVSAFNRPEDVLNNDGDFVLNDGSVRTEFKVPNDVLYTSLDDIELVEGTQQLIKPFADECQPMFSGLEYTNRVCLSYTGDTLPELDTAAPTLWELVSDDPLAVLASTFSGILTYGTMGAGTRTAYKNNTPLLDAPSLRNEATFRLRVAQDATLGTDDSQIRVGWSAPGMTVALAFLTHPVTAQRFVLVKDLKSGRTLGSVTFDFLDGAYHTYTLRRDPSAGEVRISIDS